jgi:nucleotide-binding universal stress UspA family protein
MYRQILVPLDGSAVAECVLPHVDALARGLGAHVRLLGCVLSDDGSDVEQERRRLAHEYLLRAAGDRLASEPVAITVVAGDAAEQVALEAGRTRDTLIAMATHGWSGARRWLMGSVTQRVLASGGCPVLVVPALDGVVPAASPPVPRTLIVPLDGSPLAETALPHALALARPLGLRLVLVRALPAAVGYYVRPDAFGGAERDRAEVIEGRAEEDLERVAADLRARGAGNVETQLVHGNVADALLDWMRTVPDRIVLLSTHGRTGLRRLALGSIAERLVHQLDGPVVVVPPDVRTGS